MKKSNKLLGNVPNYLISSISLCPRSRYSMVPSAPPSNDSCPTEERRFPCRLRILRPAIPLSAPAGRERMML